MSVCHTMKDLVNIVLRDRQTDRQTDRQIDRDRDRENSNSKTLFYKDCSLGSVQKKTNN